MTVGYSCDAIHDLPLVTKRQLPYTILIFLMRGGVHLFVPLHNVVKKPDVLTTDRKPFEPDPPPPPTTTG